MSIEQYAITGGRAGRERLRILSRVLRPQTLALFEQLGIAEGMSCLDMGSGGGDVAFELAALVGPKGRVLGLDIDDEKLAIARREASERGLDNVLFRNATATDPREAGATFDIAFARQLLCHVPDPGQMLDQMIKRLAPGGLVAVEDIDFSGHFTYPPCPAMATYMGLVRQTIGARGGDADIGPKLPGLLLAAGLEDVQIRVAQPVARIGEAKLIHPITMESILDAVVTDGLGTAEEVQEIADQLYACAEDPHMVMSLPRYIQTWGRRPKS